MSDHLLEDYNKNRYSGGKSGDRESDWLFDNTATKAPVSDVDQAWENVSKKILNQSNKSKAFPFLQIAASIALITVSFFVFRGYFTHSPDLIVKQSHREKVQITFPDGSEALLNNNSSVKFLEKFGNTREVYFSGEAYFAIKKSEKPFFIKTDNVDVRVLGTAFNLVTGEEEVKVLVERGLVALERGSKQVNVGSGELGIFNSKTSEMLVDTTPPTNVMSWRNGKFSFQDIALIDATVELEKYYDITFKLSPAIEKCRITVNFDNAPLKEVLDIFGTILSVHISQNNSNVQIKGKSCQ